MKTRYRVTYGQMRKSDLIPGALIGERKTAVIGEFDTRNLAEQAAELFLEGKPLIDLVELPPLGDSPAPSRDVMPVYEAN